MSRMQEKMDRRVRSKMSRNSRAAAIFGAWLPAAIGLLDDYRTETLRRLEDEQREFKEFLERLRFAKDRAEFDQFMNERRNRPTGDGPQAPPQS